jgi:hypothetical protein
MDNASNDTMISENLDDTRTTENGDRDTTRAESMEPQFSKVSTGRP